MSENKFKTTVGMCVIALTKHIMDKESLNQEEAYKKLIATELYKLLNDMETRLYLETNEYLCEAYDQENDCSIESLYDFINAK